MINRDSWGHSYFVVRGEIPGFTKDKLMQKHLHDPRAFYGNSKETGFQG